MATMISGDRISVHLPPVSRETLVALHDLINEAVWLGEQGIPSVLAPSTRHVLVGAEFEAVVERLATFAAPDESDLSPTEARLWGQAADMVREHHVHHADISEAMRVALELESRS